jgi:hypothetical protein
MANLDLDTKERGGAEHEQGACELITTLTTEPRGISIYLSIYHIFRSTCCNRPYQRFLQRVQDSFNSIYVFLLVCYLFFADGNIPDSHQKLKKPFSNLNPMLQPDLNLSLANI